jgi:hypothetical protein
MRPDDEVIGLDDDDMKNDRRVGVWVPGDRQQQSPAHHTRKGERDEQDS